MKKEEKFDKSKFEKLNDINKINNVNLSEGFYYFLGIILSIILIFSTDEFLRTVNYLFVIIFAVISVIKILSFILEKKYHINEYNDLSISIISLWFAIVIFKYGAFLFLELLPVMVSLLLFLIGLSSFTKYFSSFKKGNLIIGILSLLLGSLLLFLPFNVMNIFLKVSGIYLLIVIVLDLFDFKVNINK